MFAPGRGEWDRNEFLAAGLIDELHLHIAPVTLSQGERLFDGVPATHLEQTA